MTKALIILHNFSAFNAKSSLNTPGVKYFMFGKIFRIQHYSCPEDGTNGWSLAD